MPEKRLKTMTRNPSGRMNKEFAEGDIDSSDGREAADGIAEVHRGGTEGRCTEGGLGSGDLPPSGPEGRRRCP